MEIWTTRTPNDAFEKTVLDALAGASLPCIVINNVIIPHPGPSPAFFRLPNEHDMLVFSDGHLYTLEMKALDPGHYRGSGTQPFEHSSDGIEWKPMPEHLDPQDKSFKKARVLEGFFGNEFPALPRPQFVSVIVVPDHADLSQAADELGRTPLGARLLMTPVSALEATLRNDLEESSQRAPKAGEMAALFKARAPELAKSLPCWINEHLRAEVELGRPKQPVPRVVYRGFDDLRRRPVRIEIIRRFAGELSSSTALRAFRANISALGELRHEAILKHYNEFEVLTSLVMVSEYFSETTLRAFTATDARPWPVLREIFAQVVGALRHAHASRIVHRHVTPESILIGSDSKPSVRLSGFFGAAVESNSVVHSPEPSNPYQAPEYGDERLWRTPMEDAFAIGRCICASLTGNPRQLPSSGAPPEILALLPRLLADHAADRKAAWERLAALL